MSKAPIRSAMMRLRQEGLIVSRGRQGNAVSPVTLRDIQEIFQLRLVLEVTAVRLAAGKVDAARLRALNEAAHAAYPEGDEAGQAAYLRANRSSTATSRRAPAISALSRWSSASWSSTSASSTWVSRCRGGSRSSTTSTTTW